jgi:cytochrome c biogenesis protein CcmG/thiol:disulfide interchange protein DsbE
MTRLSARPVLLDILSGVAAIIVVVATCIAFKSVGNDFRGIYAMTAAAFFVAGFARGKASAGRLGWQAARVSVGGLLGNAALLVNNGPHLFAVQAGLIVTAVSLSTAGLLARGNWSSNRGFSVRLALLSLAAAALFVLFAVPQLATWSAFQAADFPSPSLTLQAADRTIHSEDLKGHVVVLAFWASWCIACVEELPELKQVYARFQNDPDVVFLAVDTGWAGETLETGNRRLARRHVTIPNVFDPGEAAKSLGVNGIPVLILVDRGGHVRFVHHGYDRSEHFEQALSHRIDELKKESR